MITEYHPSYAARARDLCMAGLSEIEIAKILGLSIGMLRAWRDRYNDFDYAWTDGTTIANTKVVAALFKKAIGYDKIIWKETPAGMMRELKHIEPHFQSQVFWLANKMPEQWQNKVEQVAPGSGNVLSDSMSDVEAARRVAFALAKVVYDQSRSIENDNATVPSKAK